jgi:hypothetical protein
MVFGSRTHRALFHKRIANLRQLFGDTKLKFANFFVYLPQKSLNMQTRTIFNPTQLHLLKMFAVNDTPEMLDELKLALATFYEKKLETKLNKMWDAGIITPQKLEEIKHSHLRAHTGI